MVSVAVAVAEVTKDDAKPVPDEECQKCGGTGWWGDGNPWRKCEECNADGKKPKPSTEVTQTKKMANLPFSVQWVKEAEAKASGKVILYYVTRTKGCPACVKLKGFMNNPASIEAMNRFACVLIQDVPAGNAWMSFYGITSVPSMVFVGPKGTTPFIQVGCPNGVPELLHFLNSMEKRFSGEPMQVVVPDSTKAFIEYPRRPTLAPAPHDTAAPLPIKGRSSEAPGRSVVKFVQRGNRCYRPSPGLWGQIRFSPSCRGCR